MFVDATGDGDLSVQAGAEFQMGREGDGMCSAATLMFRIGDVDMEALLSHLEKHPEDLKRNEFSLSSQYIRQCVFGDPPMYARAAGTRAPGLTSARRRKPAQRGPFSAPCRAQ